MKKLMNYIILFALIITGCGSVSGGHSNGENSGENTNNNPPIAESTYTVTWKNWDGNVLETDHNVAYGSTPTYDGLTPTKNTDEYYDYSFDGWSPNVGPVVEDTVYVATFVSSKIKYVIDFDLNGGSSSSYSGSKTVEAFTKDIFFFDCMKEEWNFRGWSYNGTKIFDEEGNQLANPVMSKNMTFVAMYAQTAKMTIVTNLEGAGNINGEGEYPYNTYVDVSAYANQGYKFIGWYYQNTLLSNTNDYKYMMWSEDVTLEARFELASFLLDVHTNNSNYGLVLLRGNAYSDYQPQYKEYRNYTTTITIAAYSKTDVRFLGWYDTDNKLVETNAVYNFFMPNHDYTLEAKWNYFAVTYNLNGGTNNSSNPTSYTIDTTAGLTLREPTKTGYDFLGWRYKGNYVTEINPSWVENITLEAIWRAHTYSISYELNGGTNNSNNPTSYTIESNTITLQDASRFGYTFAGWYGTASFSNQVIQITKGSYGDLTLYAKWTPVSYSITYNLDGGINASSNPSTYTIESAFTFASPNKTGYTFLGWFDGDGNQVTSIVAGTTGVLVLTAHWTPSLNNLSIASEDTTKGTVAITSGSGYSNESITVVASPVGDCVFKGWYHEDTKVSNEATYTFTMPTSDYSLVAHFFTKAEEEESWNISHGVVPTISEDGKTITYGLYPQTNINDSTLVSALNGLITPKSNGWYLYKGDYYAKVNATPDSSYYKFDNGTTIVNGTTYWFKCEPITWKVLNNNAGQYYIVSSVLLDAHCYYNSTSTRTFNNGRTIAANDYEYSDIRSWLNADFYNSAFALGNEKILTTTVDNMSYYYSGVALCNNTQDKVFLPSYRDYTRSIYGFSEGNSSTDTRYCRTTDWARARGAYCFTGVSVLDSYLYNGMYWTRSGSTKGSSTNSGDFVWHVGYNGNLNYYFVNKTYYCVRPAITLSIA